MTDPDSIEDVVAEARMLAARGALDRAHLWRLRDELQAFDGPEAWSADEEVQRLAGVVVQGEHCYCESEELVR